MNRETFSQRQTFTGWTGSKIKMYRKTFADGKSGITLSGYPIVWNQLSSDRGGYVVKLAANSAKFASPTLALWAHDFSRPLASTANGSLRIGEADDTGIPIVLDLLMTTTIGADTAEYVAADLVSSMSFSMANGFEQYTEAKDGDQNVLTCTAFTADEVSIVINPAFTNSFIGIKPDNQDDPPTDDPQIQPQTGGMSKLNRAKMKLRRVSIDRLSL